MKVRYTVYNFQKVSKEKLPSHANKIFLPVNVRFFQMANLFWGMWTLKQKETGSSPKTEG